MRFSLACALMTASFVVAQTSDHLIMVGQGGLMFTPSNISANPGDTVTFQFMAKNHSATQTTFPTPCTQLQNTTVNPPIIGISSGFMPVASGATTFPQWRFQVLDTTPLWFMCAQTGHCQQGMVFSINATPQKSFDQYLQNAKTGGNTTLAPQTNGAQTPASGTTTPGSSQPNGAPVVSGAAAAPSTSKPAAALRGVSVPATSGLLIASLFAVFGTVL